MKCKYIFILLFCMSVSSVAAASTGVQVQPGDQQLAVEQFHLNQIAYILSSVNSQGFYNNGDLVLLCWQELRRRGLSNRDNASMVMEVLADLLYYTTSPIAVHIVGDIASKYDFNGYVIWMLAARAEWRLPSACAAIEKIVQAFPHLKAVAREALEHLIDQGRIIKAVVEKTLVSIGYKPRWQIVRAWKRSGNRGALSASWGSRDKAGAYERLRQRFQGPVTFLSE